MYNIIALLFIHWVADFVCQTDWMAQNKSKEWKPLLTHTLLYSFVTMALLFIWFHIQYGLFNNYLGLLFLCFKFSIITLWFHTVTDYFTSRLNSKLWNEKKVHWFFVSVGFDQFLHYLQLLLTYKYLFS